MPERLYPDSGRFRSYRRHLPHYFPEGFPVFFTWNLKGSLPKAVAKDLEIKRTQLEEEPPVLGESSSNRKIREQKILFSLRDNYLDGATDGPLHLREPTVAKIVVDSILFGAPERYELYAFVVMANHVHLVILPRREPEEILQGIKGFTSRQINRLHQRTGRVFWQDETYDHWVRDLEELRRIIEYVENNPVVAGLCAKSEDWIWSSAAMRKERDWKKGDALLKG
jgi:putative transposase